MNRGAARFAPGVSRPEERGAVPPLRVAVVGHVEWVEFARVPELPTAGSIVHATEVWSEPAGGGAVVARQIARLVGRCEFFTALGADCHLVFDMHLFAAANPAIDDDASGVN